MKRKPELLAPAGDMERLKMAVAYGADAVYLAGTTFGMRAFAGNFDEQSIYDATRLCHEAGVRTHVTINTMPRKILGYHTAQELFEQELAALIGT